jgi:glutaredoxin 3
VQGELKPGCGAQDAAPSRYEEGAGREKRARSTFLQSLAAASRPRQHGRVRAIVYTWSSCSFCRRAKELLEQSGITYREVLLDGKKDELRALQEAFGVRTLPLVLLDGERLAGLAALEAALRG